MDAQAVSWFCGSVRTEPEVIGSRIVRYRYVVVGGCGQVNPPNVKECKTCGREKK